MSQDLMSLLLLSENLLWVALIGSMIILMSITVERYLKVVHSSWSKKILRKWMSYSAVAFAWISSFVYNMTVVFSTSAVIDGVCYGYVIWSSRAAKVAHGVWYFASFFVVVLFVLVFCYGRILVVVRRQARVMAGHSDAGPESSTAQVSGQWHQIQTNVVKTMILVGALYVITWTPNSVFYLIVNISPDLTLIENGYYVVIFVAFLYTCTNPFIYAAKFDPVKRVLLALILCKKSQQVGPGVETVTART